MRTQPILSNPEFQRNIWQELTPHRLIGGVVILSILAWLSYATSSNNSFYWISFAIIFIWGIKLASESIQEELQHGTWDYQRISALSPFKFTWGKLLGTTSYSWYLATLSFIGFIGLGLYLEEPLNLLLNQYFVFILCGLFGQYTAMTLSLNAIQFGRDKHYSFRYFVFAFIISSLFCYALMLPLDLKSPTYQYAHQHLNWYQFEIATYPFYLALVAILLFWSILGSYRLIRAEFQYKNLPYVGLDFVYFGLYILLALRTSRHLEVFLKY
jgi:hypothetical protein